MCIKYKNLSCSLERTKAYKDSQITQNAAAYLVTFDDFYEHILTNNVERAIIGIKYRICTLFTIRRRCAAGKSKEVSS